MNEDRSPASSALERVVAAWHASVELHELSPPATEDEVSLAEIHLGRTLPPVFRRLYSTNNGLALFRGNLNVYPLRATNGDSGLLTRWAHPLADELREWRWRIADELVVIGDNGGDEMFGVWLPTGEARSSAPIVEIAELGEPIVGLEEVEGLAVAGTDLERFLVSRTAYYSLLYEAGSRALDLLGVPTDLRVDDPGDDVFAALHAWADPELLDRDPDPYRRPVGASRLRKQFGANAS